MASITGTLRPFDPPAHTWMELYCGQWQDQAGGFWEIYCRIDPAVLYWYVNQIPKDLTSNFSLQLGRPPLTFSVFPL